MRIKQVELKGFKSFKKKTIVRFSEGINCIVGPNGCGKSNIFDAFLWVMGETSPSRLRGSSMEEMIFTGSRAQAPSGVVEVSLVLEKTQGAFLPAPYKNFSEIMLTRRLDRDGKSEYLLNSKLCRLKDIQDIFIDTGSGAQGFSFIEQGAIERFISSKPEQKRKLIETAAGISRFRIKKREAEKKLQLTQNNLKRLEDLLEDQARRLEKLKKQSEKALIFKNLKTEIQEKDLEISRQNLQSLESNTQRLNQNLHEEQKKIHQFQKQLENLNTDLEQSKQTYESKKKEQNRHTAGLAESRSAVQAIENSLAGLSSSLQARLDNKTSFQQEAQLSHKNKTKTLQLLSENKQALADNTAKQKDQSGIQESLNHKYTQQERRCADLEAEYKAIEQKFLELKQQESFTDELKNSYQQSAEEWKENKKEYSALLEKKQQEQKKLSSKKKQLQDQLEQEKQLSFNLSQQEADLKQDLDTLQQNILNKEKAFQEACRQVDFLYSEQESLKKWKAYISSEEKGFRLILNQKTKEQFTSTAEAVRLSSPVLESAVSSFLESRLKSLFCSKTAAVSALPLLTKKNTGSCRFILADFQQKKAPSKEELQSIKQTKGFKYFLTDKLTGSAQIIERLFSRIAVVENLSSALRLKEQFPLWAVISLTGETLTEEGDLTAGKWDNESASTMNILTYNRAMQEIPLKYKHWTKKKKTLGMELEAEKTLFQKKSKDLTALRKTKGSRDVFVFGINKDMEALLRDAGRLSDEMLQLEQKIQLCHKKLKELQEKQHTLKSSSYSVQGQMLEQKLKQIKKECNAQETKKSELLIKKTQTENKISNYEAQIKSLQVKQELLHQSLEQEAQRGKSLSLRSQEKQEHISQEKEEIKQQKTQLQKALEQLNKQETSVKTLNEDCERQREITDQKQNHIIDLHNQLSETKNKIGEIQNELSSCSLKKSSLTARINELYQIELKLEHSSNSSSVFDEESAVEDLKKMNSRLSRMGAVNLLALEEKEELLKENAFYQKQYEDLNSSKEQLSSAIKKIDRFCSEKFQVVFEQVNTCFSKIFQTLFEGGTAKMQFVLSEEGEEGVDILVQPPGKKIQNMNLLSGGEKAMTAISVIFSIFMIKPSPFCILDEVDAPLDDVNILRFNSLLSEMANISQVIIISHNKHTMKNSRRLYGVTMEEKGISKVLSLNMKPPEKAPVQNV